MRKYLASVVAAVLSLAAVPAFALGTPIDVTEVSLQFAELNTAIIAIGGLLLIAAVLAVGYKWAKAMIFG